MKLITWNLWHGLSGTGVLRFGELESAAERKQRYANQVERLARTSFDFFCAQEVNPLPARVPEFESATRAQSISCNDNSGLKFRGLGLPLNLNSGLAIFYNPDWTLIKSDVVRLSGSPLSVQNEKYSLQLTESRYALIGQFRNEDGFEITVVNLHLHHGFQWQPGIFEKIFKAHPQMTNQQQVALRQILARGEVRRTQEIETLMSHLESHEHPVVLAGDFNISSDSIIHAQLRDSGFNDMWARKHPKDETPTWDHVHNVDNHKKLEGFHSDVQLDPEIFPKAVAETIKSVVYPLETRPRRIDYFFLRDPSNAIQIDDISLYANEPEEYGQLDSDHFGLDMDIVLPKG